MIDIQKYLNPDLISPIHATSRDDALKQLVDLAESYGLLQDREALQHLYPHHHF